MEALKLMVPTYNGKWLKGTDIKLADFDDPLVPVLVHQAEGVRIALGTHDHPNNEKPDIQIERRHNGWMIFLHPLGGSDASGYVVFLDDGRSFIVEGSCCGSTEPIEMVEYDEAIAELDDVLPSGLSCTPTMVVQKSSAENDPASDQRESTSKPPVPPLADAQLFVSRAVIKAFASAKQALAGDSNDDEHDALWAFVEALGVYRLGEFRAYCPATIVADFCGWAGLDQGDPPDQEVIEDYVRQARPADSSPLDVNRVLHEWADAMAKDVAEPCP